MQTVTWKQTQKNKEFNPSKPKKLSKRAPKISQNQPKSQKTWAAKKRKAPLCWQCCRALVSPKWYSAAKEERKMPAKWSSGRACGAASTTQRSETTSKNFLNFQQKYIKNAQKRYQKRDQVNEMMLERFPLRLEVCKDVQKQARTAPKRRRKGAKKELWPQRVAKRVPKKAPEVIKNWTFGILMLKV